MKGCAISRAANAVRLQNPCFCLRQSVTIVGGDLPFAAPTAVFQLSQFPALTEGTVGDSAIVRENAIAAADGIDALREQRPRVGGIDVLNVIEEARGGLDLAEAHTEALVCSVVRGRPIQSDRVPEVPEQEIAALDGDAQLGNRLRSNVEHRFRPCRAAIAGMRGEYVVVGGVKETLGCVAVDLNIQVFEALGESVSTGRQR